MSKRNKSQKTANHMIPLHKLPRTAQLVRAESRLAEAEGVVKKKLVTADKLWVSFYNHGHILKLMAVIVTQLCDYTKKLSKLHSM